jgi:serine/threonine protein phosphatase 1
MSKNYVMGDIHGEYDKLMRCLESVNFSDSDTLIQLGDVVDRGKNSYECVEALLQINNLISIKGNHDDCFYKGLLSGTQGLFSQGARETCMSYIRALDIGDRVTPYDLVLEHIPVKHYEFFKNQLLYHVDSENRVFVHGGFNRHYHITDLIYNNANNLMWDRDLIYSVKTYSTMKESDKKIYPFKTKDDFKEIFLGHTPVQHLEKTDNPLNYYKIWLLDTGSGKGGLLTIMNLESKKYKQF